jgi:hypothetical protein
MKRRVLVAASLASLALPSLLTDAGLASLPLAESVAHAQGAPAATPTDPVTEAARQKYQEGVRDFEAGKYEDARSAFLQAYALKRVPAVLLNLGQSEIKAGHYEDGGNHLQQFIRDHKAATPDQVTAAQNGIAEAKKKTGYVVIIVNAVGADVSIDGTAIGKSPLLDPYFIKPGKHVVYASAQGSAGTVAVDVKKGIASSAQITLNVTTPAPTATTPAPTATTPVPTAPTATTPVPTAAPTYTAPAPTYPYPTATAPYIPPGTYDPLAPPPPTGTGLQPPVGQREDVFHWFKRKPVAWVGVGATAVGLIMGIGFSAAAGGAASSANNYANQIKTRANQVGLTTSPCGKENDPTDDNPAMFGTDGKGNKVDACETLRSSLGQYRADVGVAATGWVLFGLGAIGTVTYALVDWYPKRNGTGTGTGLRVTGVAPAVSPTQAGIGVIGVF